MKLKIKYNSIFILLTILFTAILFISCGEDETPSKDEKNSNISSEYGKHCKDLEILVLNDDAELDCKDDFCFEDSGSAFCANPSYCTSEYGTSFRAVPMSNVAPTRDYYACDDQQVKDVYECRDNAVYLNGKMNEDCNIGDGICDAGTCLR